MAKSIIYYQKGRREFLDQLYQNGIFGLTASIDNKEQAVFIASLGVNDPVELKSTDNGGWFRTDSIHTAKEKAMLCMPLLGTFETDEDVDSFTDYDTYVSHFEKCAEKGFQIIEEKMREAKNDNVLLERRMLKELDLKFTQLVENDI